MNFIVTNRQDYFDKIGQYNYCSISDISLPRVIACDSETTAIKTYEGELFAIQVGTGTDNYLFDIESIDIQEVFELIQDKVLVFHNAKFDLGWFYKYGFFPWKVRDTFLASKILYNGISQYRHGFGYVMERELGLQYDKSEQKNIAKVKLSTAKAIQYCFNDVDKLLDLDRALNIKIIEGGYLPAYQLHRRHIRALAYMEQCGLPISEELWDKKISSDIEEMKKKEKIVVNYIYKNLPQFRKQQLDLFSTEEEIMVNLDSPAQMIPVFNALGINTLDGEGKESTAEDVITKTKHEFNDIWLDYKSISHDVSTFGENFKPHIYKGRLYTQYNPILDTARISAGGKDVEGNPQINTLNLPANQKTRSCFVANPGFKYIVADYEGQENTVGADQHGDPVMISSVVNGDDLHCAFARVLYPELKDLSDDEIKKNHKDKRTDAKSPRFLFSYGGNAYTLNATANIPMPRALEIEAAYKELHAGIYEWGEKRLKEAIKLGYIHYWGGFRLHLWNFDFFKKKHVWITLLDKDFWTNYRIGKREFQAEKKAKEEKKEYIVKNKASYDLYRKNVYDISQYFKAKANYFKLCLNGPIQGVSAFQTKAAVNKIYEYIWKKKHFWKARISLALHDEIGMEVIDELAEEYKKVIEDSMINEGNRFLSNPLLTMRTEAKISTDWYTAK